MAQNTAELPSRLRPPAPGDLGGAREGNRAETKHSPAVAAQQSRSRRPQQSDGQDATQAYDFVVELNKIFGFVKKRG